MKLNEDRYGSLCHTYKENSGKEVGIYPSFQESLNRVKIKSSVSLSDHFKFRLTEAEINERLKIKSRSKRKGMIVYKFYKDMLDSGVRVTGKGNKNLDSGAYGFMYGLSQ